MPQELKSDSSFVTDSHCNLGKGTYPHCASVKDLPWVIGFIETYFTNGCEDDIRFHNTRKQSIVTSISIMGCCMVQGDIYSAVKLRSENILPLAKFSYLARDRQHIFLLLVWAFGC